MAAAKEPDVAEWKRELVSELKEKFSDYPVVGILNISGIPAPQFQEMRSLLRGRAEIKVGRRVLLRVAMEKSAEDNSGLEELKEYLEGPCALIFTEMNPFQLWKVLEDNKTNAPAKAGMESPEDIVIPAGETDFSPGPIIGELQRAGVNARIQAGKIVVLEDSKIVEEGEEISEEVVGVLSKFDIEPREIGFELLAAYEDGTVFHGSMLEVDEEKTMSQLRKAFADSLALTMEVSYPTSTNIEPIISQASSQAHSLALGASIFTPGVMPEYLRRAITEMNNLARIVHSNNEDALDEDLRSQITSTQPTRTEKEEKTKEKPEEKEEKEEVKEEETEEDVNLGGLFE
ncbi:MAG: 50S ribosomal protein L10 [Hadesarchaea archaeon]|nr:50S ribosomal protein L10 [Hadesarchaea archaeon]